MVISSQLKNMEWLLLLLLSSAAAGAVAYFFRDNAQDVSSVSQKEKEQESKKKLIEQENLENLGARSSPQLPEAKQKIRFSVEKSDLEKFKDYIKKVPSPIQPEVIQTDDLKKTLQDVKQDRYRKKKPLKVTYTTDEIIPRISPFSRHRRPLQNAEKFVEEQKAKEALSIYERLLKRIPDEEIKQKIQKNIDDIKRWLLGLDEDEETIEFPEIIIPLTAQTVAIEKFNEGLKQISEDIAREIAKAFADGIKDIKATLNVSDAKIEAKEIKAQQFNAEAKEIKSEKFLVGESNIVGSDTGADRVIEAKEVRAEKLSVGGAGGVGDGAGGGRSGGIGADRVIEAKEVRAEKLSVGGAGGVGGGAGGGRSGGIGADRVIESKEVRADKLSVGGAGGISTGKKEETQTSIEKKEIIISRSKEPEELSPKAPHTVYYIVPSFVRKIPKTIQKQKGIPEIEQAEIPLPIGPKVPTRPEEYFQSILIKEGFQFDEEGNLITDGWTDKDFDREWGKYKHLPLIDRRSGLDRRKEFDFDPSRPDRRSGEDRRKINLFEEREKFLEKYLKHLERKEILEKYKDFQNNKELSVYETPETKENIVISIPPSAEELGLEELEEIELPEPISEKFEDLQESIKTIQIDVEPISDEIEKEEKSEVEITPSITSGTLDSEKLEEQEEIELEELNLPEAESQENDMLSLEIPEIEPIEIQETTQEPEKEGIPYSKVEIIEPPINLEELNLPDPEEIIVEELEQKSFPSMPQQEYPQPLQEQQEQTEALQKPEKPEEGMPQPQEPSLEPKQEQLSEGVEELDFPDVPEAPEKKGPVQEIRGVLELKPPDEDDAPFLTLTYDFSKIPDSFQLSKNYHTLEYVYYKYKPLLIKAQEFARRKMLKNALNYYRMIKSQNIPPEFKRMINRNIQDITDYIEKFMMSRTND
jgi:hypothetical protein